MRIGNLTGRHAGDKLFAYLKRAGYPPGYQVLCFNCNCGRAKRGGVCPHKAKVMKCE